MPRPRTSIVHNLWMRRTARRRLRRRVRGDGTCPPTAERPMLPWAQVRARGRRRRATGPPWRKAQSKNRIASRLPCMSAAARPTRTSAAARSAPAAYRRHRNRRDGARSSRRPGATRPVRRKRPHRSWRYCAAHSAYIGAGNVAPAPRTPADCAKAQGCPPMRCVTTTKASRGDKIIRRRFDSGFDGPWRVCATVLRLDNGKARWP